MEFSVGDEKVQGRQQKIARVARQLKRARGGQVIQIMKGSWGQEALDPTLSRWRSR